MVGVDLSYADLSNVDLSDCNLYQTNLIGANLREAKLQGVILEESKIIDFINPHDDATPCRCMVHLAGHQAAKTQLGITSKF